jgi:hypothetical protein
MAANVLYGALSDALKAYPFRENAIRDIPQHAILANARCLEHPNAWTELCNINAQDLGLRNAMVANALYGVLSDALKACPFQENAIRDIPQHATLANARCLERPNAWTALCKIEFSLPAEFGHIIEACGVSSLHPKLPCNILTAMLFAGKQPKADQYSIACTILAISNYFYFSTPPLFLGKFRRFSTSKTPKKHCKKLL